MIYLRRPGRISHSSDPRYILFGVKKHSGSERRIEAPNSALKARQRKILEILRDAVKVSPFSFGVRRGPYQAAQGHFAASLLIRVDVSSFFTSITYEIMHRHGTFERLSEASGISVEEIADAVLIRAEDGSAHLPQGAPTSPLVADILMFQTDYLIARALMRAAVQCDIPPTQVAYSRYIDDMIVSLGSGVCEPAARRFGHRATGILVWALNRTDLDPNPGKTMQRLALDGRRMVTLGYSVGGLALQAPRAMKDKARRIVWKVGRGEALTARERSFLSYVLTGRLRIPSMVRKATQGRSDRDSMLLTRQSGRTPVDQRNFYMAIPNVLQERFRGIADVHESLPNDAPNAFDIALVTRCGDARVETRSKTHYLIGRDYAIVIDRRIILREDPLGLNICADRLEGFEWAPT